MELFLTIVMASITKGSIVDAARFMDPLMPKARRHPKSLL